MVSATLIAGLALLVALVPTAAYLKDRRDVRRSLMGVSEEATRIRYQVERARQDFSDASRALVENAKDPDYLGRAAGAAIERFFSNCYVPDENGDEVLLTPPQAVQAMSAHLVAVGASIVAPMFMEELPVFLAAIGKPSLAGELAEKSHMARGVSKLGKGISGVQAVAHTLGKLTGNSKMGQAAQWLQIIPELQKLGPLLSGDGDGNGSSSDAQSSSDAPKEPGGYTGPVYA